MCCTAASSGHRSPGLAGVRRQTTDHAKRESNTAQIICNNITYYARYRLGVEKVFTFLEWPYIIFIVKSIGGRETVLTPNDHSTSAKGPGIGHYKFMR